MKAILEFNLNDHDDRMDHYRCIKSTDMACALFDILVNLRRTAEAQLDSLEADSDKYDGAEVVYNIIHTFARDHNIDIEELIN